MKGKWKAADRGLDCWTWGRFGVNMCPVKCAISYGNVLKASYQLVMLSVRGFTMAAQYVVVGKKGSQLLIYFSGVKKG
jgi:hypothetical protein